MEPWVVVVLRWVTGFHWSQLFHCLLFRVIPLPSGECFHGEIEALIAYGAVELAPLSPGFATFHLFRRLRGLGGPLMDLSSLNGSVHQTLFSDGIASFHPSRCQEVRLYDLNQPQGCVSPGSYSSRQSRIFFGSLWTECLFSSRSVLRSLLALLCSSGS